MDLLAIIANYLSYFYPPEKQQYSKYKLDDLHEHHPRWSVLLGPVVFTSFPNVLQKKSTRVLLRRFGKGKTAWEIGLVNGQLQPWYLPVLAYAIMIRLYAEEAKKAHFYGKEVDRTMPISFQKPFPLSICKDLRMGCSRK